MTEWLVLSARLSHRNGRKDEEGEPIPGELRAWWERCPVRARQPSSSGDFWEGFLEEVPAELSLDG